MKKKVASEKGQDANRIIDELYEMTNNVITLFTICPEPRWENDLQLVRDTITDVVLAFENEVDGLEESWQKEEENEIG